MLAAAIPTPARRLTRPLLLLRALCITQLIGVAGSRIVLIFLVGAASPILALLITSGCRALSRRMGTSLFFGLSSDTSTIFLLALFLGCRCAWYIQ